jgi:hypothetical protein
VDRTREIPDLSSGKPSSASSPGGSPVRRILDLERRVQRCLELHSLDLPHAPSGLCEECLRAPAEALSDQEAMAL